MQNIKAVITQQAGKIDLNYDQVHAAIQERLEEYQNAFFTEDSKGIAKKELAGLRAEKKSLMDRVKESKESYMAPWNDFEKRVKELISLYDQPIELIDRQIKAFENRRVEEKRELIRQIYEETAGELREVLPLEKIYNKKWENATYKEKDIRRDLISIMAAAGQAISTIRAMGSEAEPKAIAIYLEQLDLGAAITFLTGYEQQKREIIQKEEERRRREEEERIRREERARLEAEREAQRRAAQAAEEERKKAEEALAAQRARLEEEKQAAMESARQEGARDVIDSLIPDPEEETSLYEYRLALSEDGKQQFEIYLDSVGIEWEMIG